MRRSCALVTALLALVTNACSVDHRHLHAQQSTGGAVSSNGGADGDAPDEPGGANGQGGTTTTKGLVDGCADLDTDGIADCKATLLSNPSFTSDTSDWQADPEVALSWDPKNALPDAPSGSARLEASVPRARVTQCVAMEEKKLVIAYANAFVTSSADGDEPGQAELEVSFFPSQDCTGDRAAFFETPPSTEVDAWSVVQAGQITVDGTRSVSIALVGLKPERSAALEVYFDNVMLKARAL
ncbi:MAG: hypothetical protein ABUL60_16455 [Myxococcales bacterium]